MNQNLRIKLFNELKLNIILLWSGRVWFARIVYSERKNKPIRRLETSDTTGRNAESVVSPRCGHKLYVYDF